MYYSKVGNFNRYLIRFERGELINESIAKFCGEQNIKNAQFSAIGSIESPTLAHYKVTTKKYSEKKFEGTFELTSLIGNVAQFNNKPLVHSHVNISDENMDVLGGHLVEAKISATVEVVLENLDSSLHKSFDEEIGLKLWDLSSKL